MSKSAEQRAESGTLDTALEAWDRLIQAFDNLPTDDAKRGFLEYARAVLDFNKLREYLAGRKTDTPKSPLNSVLVAMKLDEERLWAHSKSGKDEIAASLLLMFQGLSCDAERFAFTQFAEAVIDYHITKNEIEPSDWQRWSM